ncbi:MAG: tRNA uridine(34) 5-carboxymethylaminomethyl modification radical SAM/GNAT enzyme Elp3 [Candidatus Woesearchaeota archaeon]
MDPMQEADKIAKRSKKISETKKSKDTEIKKSEEVENNKDRGGNNKERSAARFIIKELIEKGIEKRENIDSLKKEVSKSFKLKSMLTNIRILCYANSEELNALKKVLTTKPFRSISGVTPIAIMTKPINCPHGKCVYCPGGLNSFFGDVPQSYTGREPAALRASRADYDAYIQVFNRLEQYIITGHNPEKVELIIMGGTFPSFFLEYQEDFVRNAFKAMNDFSKLFYGSTGFDFERFKEFFELPADVKNPERTERIKNKVLELKNKSKKSLENEKKRNESSRIKCVAFCIETRPDYSLELNVKQMLRLGTTRVELGVQTLYDSVLKKIKRGHSVEDVERATQILKDSFLKVGYHMMLGLPGSSKETDVEMFKTLFEDQRFKPDALKIYPTMVLKGTELYDSWKKGYFKPLSTEEACDLVIKIKEFIPEYCRIMRIQRDIPTKFTDAGVSITNFRQYVDSKMRAMNKKCRCIRCREPREKKIDFDSIKLKRFDYEASNSTEVFLSFEDVKNDLLIGFLRLRIPYKPFLKFIDAKTAGIREVHVYGTAVPIGQKSSLENQLQHRGFGRELVREAERIAEEEFSIKKILVISGIGVRDYYRKLGYKKFHYYMMKRLV